MATDAPGARFLIEPRKTVVMAVLAGLFLMLFQAETHQLVVDVVRVYPHTGLAEAGVARVATHAGSYHAGMRAVALQAAYAYFFVALLAISVGGAQKTVMAGGTGQLFRPVRAAQGSGGQIALAGRRHRR